MTPTACLDHMENLLSYISSIWVGLLDLTGDININCLKPENPITKQYSALLDVFNLTQRVIQPTRVTRHSKTLIDHIITNLPERVTHTGVIPCSIVSDHHFPVAYINVRVERFKSVYKYIRNTRDFVEQDFLNDFSELPFSLIYSTDNPDEQLQAIAKKVETLTVNNRTMRVIQVSASPIPLLPQAKLFPFPLGTQTKG